MLLPQPGSSFWQRDTVSLVGDRVSPRLLVTAPPSVQSGGCRDGVEWRVTSHAKREGQQLVEIQE